MLREFLECCDIGRDGEVSFDDFYGFYNNISPLIEDDNFFQMMLWNTWNIGGSGVLRGATGASPMKVVAGWRSTLPLHVLTIACVFSKARQFQCPTCYSNEL